MYYLVLGVSKIILHISRTVPIKVTEDDLTFIRLSDNNSILENGDYEVVAVDELPLGMIPLKYCYNDGKFVINSNYNDQTVVAGRKN